MGSEGHSPTPPPASGQGSSLHVLPLRQVSLCSCLSLHAVPSGKQDQKVFFVFFDFLSGLVFFPIFPVSPSTSAVNVPSLFPACASQLGKGVFHPFSSHSLEAALGAGLARPPGRPITGVRIPRRLVRSALVKGTWCPFLASLLPRASG